MQQTHSHDCLSKTITGVHNTSMTKRDDRMLQQMDQLQWQRLFLGSAGIGEQKWEDSLRRWRRWGTEGGGSLKDAGFCLDAETEWSKSPMDSRREMWHSHLLSPPSLPHTHTQAAMCTCFFSHLNTLLCNYIGLAAMKSQHTAHTRRHTPLIELRNAR